MIVSSELEKDSMTSEFNAITGEYLRLDGEKYFRIANSHLMDDFFMSIVSVCF